VSSAFGREISAAMDKREKTQVESRLDLRTETSLRPFQFLILAAFFGILVAVVVQLPPRGDVDSPVHQTVNAVGTPVAGTYYIQHAYADAKTPNMVTVILADYRAFDTLGETIVVFAGGIACFYILNLRRRKP
jgi:multicomponent Na+:H+ antiporter subunit B